MSRHLPNDADFGLSYGSYISLLRDAGSYHWYSSTASVHQVRDYVWELMGLAINDIVDEWPLYRTRSLSFVGAQSASEVSIITCFWHDDAGSNTIMSAAQKEWDGMREQLSRGVFRGLPWGMRSTLMMNGEIDEKRGLPELLDYLQDGSVVRLLDQYETSE